MKQISCLQVRPSRVPCGSRPFTASRAAVYRLVGSRLPPRRRSFTASRTAVYRLVGIGVPVRKMRPSPPLAKKMVTLDGKTRKVQTLIPVATAVTQYKAEHPEGNGSSSGNGSTGSNGNSGSETGGDNGGNSGGGSSTGSETGGSSTGSETLASPTISGTTPFAESTQVTMSGPAEAEIRYTTDGSTPTTESTLYSEALTLTDTTTVKAIAVKGDLKSEVATKTFTKTSGDNGGLSDDDD